MTPPLFVVSSSDYAALTVGATFTLAGDEGRHAVTVRRIGTAEIVRLGDGLGNVATATVLSTDGRDRLTVTIESLESDPAPSPSVTLVQALIKGERMERALETTTEAGIDRIVVWAAANSIVRWRDEQSDKAMAKLGRRIVEASKQSRRGRFPGLIGPWDTRTLVANLANGSLVPGSGPMVVLVLDEGAQASLADIDYSLADHVVLIVGPEGGITDHERAVLVAAGAQTVQMGSTVMRASTAGTVALGAVFAAIGRWTPVDNSNVPD